MVILTCSSHLYLMRQKHLQKSVKERFSKKPLQFVTVFLKNNKTVKAGDELVINHKMFDIEAVLQNPDGSLLLQGHFDEEETKLLRLFADSQEEKETEDTATVAPFSQFQFTNTESLIYQLSDLSLKSDWAKPMNTSRLPHTIQDILIPPPKA